MQLSEASVTRPNDTTTYTAGDVVGGVLRFSNYFMTGRITSAVMIDSVVASTKPEFDLFLFDHLPTVAADNAAFAPTDAEIVGCTAVVPFLAADFKATATSGVTITAVANALGQCVFALDGCTVYGVLVARNSYIPAAYEVFTVRLGVVGE